MSDHHEAMPADARIAPVAQPAPPTGRQPHVTGILLVLAALVLVNCSDAIAKLMTERVPVFEVVLFQALALVLMGPVVARDWRIHRLIRTSDARLQALRSACQFGSAVSFYWGLKYLALADIVAILFVGPLVVTAMAHVFLGERVGSRRWAACLAGLVGGLVIVRPGSGVMGWPAILPVLAVICFSGYVILTRHIAARNRTGNMMLWASLVGAVCLLAASPLYWQWPHGIEWLALAAIGVISACSNGLTIRAYGLAPASLLAPFSYAEIVGATILSLLIWHQFPDAWTWAGAAIIVAAGLYTFHRERAAGAPS